MIRKLAPHVIQNIAAGELVERPSSVLKELIENSIDAEATQIKVEHQAGGLHLLRVSDNGRGIRPEEIDLVFESHATSKIQTVEDLSRIKSMGFRGEAMSSIGSVARVKIWTAPSDSDTGTEAEVRFGHWIGKKPADRREGTEVSVWDLFEKLPARRKFLKSELSEARALLQLFKKYALTYPELQWTFGDAEQTKERLGKSSFFDRALWFFEPSSPEHFFEAEGVRHSWTLRFIGTKPRYLKPNRQGIHLYLNRRPIKDRSLDFAVRRAFDGFAERPQEVSGVLWIEGDPESFDVNVHPSKTEVRFQDPQPLFSAIVGVIRSSLDRLHQVPRLEVSELPRGAVSEAAPLSLVADTKPSSISWGQVSSALPAAVENPSSGFFSSKYEFLGSLQKTYWIVKKEEVLLLFDQHALHERILYEKLLKEVQAQKRLASQRLLFPMTIDFEGAEELLKEEELLERLGFELRQWRQSGIQLLASPALLKKDHAKALEEIARCREGSEESYLREILARIACHSALRAHDEVYPEQAQKILEQFDSDDALGHCPHGRPTFVQFETKHIEKFFHRV